MTFPKSVADVASAQQVTQQVTPQVELLLTVISNEHSRKEIQESLKLSDRNNFSENYLKPALDLKVIEMTIPDKPQSSKQQYRLTALGKSLLK
jgi:ATP-dependent DNA helicase RecG